MPTGAGEVREPVRSTWHARLRTHWKGLVAAGAVTLFSLWLLNAGALPILPKEEALLEPSFAGLSGFVALTALALFIRAGRFHFLMSERERPSLGRLLSINFAFFGLNVVLPLRLGELSRPLLLARHGTVSAIKALALSVAERIVDGVVGSSLLVIGLLLSTLRDPLPRQVGQLDVNAGLVPAAAYGTCAMFGCALLGALLFARHRALARRLMERASRPLGTRHVRRVAQVLETLGEGLEVLGQRGSLAPFLALTLLFWLCSALGLWWLAKLYGIEQVGPAEATVVLGILALGVMLPSAPGFFGAFQVAGYVGLALFLPAGQVVPLGEGFVFWVYAVHVGTPIILAAISWPYLLGHQRKTNAAASPSTSEDGSTLVGSEPSP